METESKKQQKTNENAKKGRPKIRFEPVYVDRIQLEENRRSYLRSLSMPSDVLPYLSGAIIPAWLGIHSKRISPVEVVGIITITRAILLIIRRKFKGLLFDNKAPYI